LTNSQNMELTLSDDELKVSYKTEDIETAKLFHRTKVYATCGPDSQKAHDTVQEICLRLANGEALTKICKDKHLPTHQCIHNWMILNKDIFALIQAARATQASYLAEETLEIADDQGIEPSHKKIMLSARHWYTSKLAPRIYGDATLLKHADADGGKLSFNDMLNQIDGEKV